MTDLSLFYFILGRNPKLSILEIVSYLNSRKLNFTVESLIEECLLINLDNRFKPRQAASILAGTIKIGKVHIVSTMDDVREVIESDNFYLEDDKKINYSINAYSKKVDRAYFVNIFKRIFKSLKQKALLKNFPPHSLSKALKTSSFVDIDIIPIEGSEEGIYVGRGISAHDIFANKKRYEKRPHIDEEIGTSIRIARILVNLAGLKPDNDILDPFCGIGTILQESLIAGLNVTGTELEEKRVNLCKNNMNWLISNYVISGTFKVMQCDARNIGDKLSPNNYDAIITEPELGPFLKSAPTYTMAREYIGKLATIYKPFFSNASKLIKKGGKLVIVLPRYKTAQGKSQEMNINRIINRSDFQLINPTASVNSKIDLKINIPYVYKEKWHQLERLIYIYEKI